MERIMQYRVPLITAVGAVLVAVIVYMAWIAPEGSKLAALRSKETQLQSQQAELDGQIATLKREKEHLGSTCATLTQEVTAVPSAPDVDSFFRQVTALAVASGDPNTPSISVTQATATAKGSGGATPVAVTFSLTGTYGQMSAFLDGLYTFPRFFTINSMQLGGGSVSNGGAVPAPGTPNYTLTLTGNIYYSSGQQNVCLSLPAS
jgi:Tfp pilus assembly protein PilO